MLAGHIADQVIGDHPGTQVITVRGALTVEHLVQILVADRPSLVILDQFDTNLTDGTITDRGLAAVLLCLMEEIADRDDERRRTRVIVTARQPLTLGPRILVHQLGALTWWSANEFARSLPRLGKLSNADREYAWRLTAGNPGSMRAFDARLADVTFAELADSLAKGIAARIGLVATALFPPGLDEPAAAAIAATVESVLNPPAVAAGVDAAPHAAAEPAGGKWRTKLRALLRVLSAAGVVAMIACAPLVIKSLIARSTTPAVAASAAAPYSAISLLFPFPSATVLVRAPSPAQHVPPAPTPEAAAATWLAGNVTSGTVIGCDPAMCASLSHQGVPQADLSPLRTGADLTTDALIVATPRARTLMGSAIAAAAPELAASFGTGTGQVQVREVTPGGVTAYSSLMAADVASRREGGNLILGNAGIKSAGDNWVVLCSGHVDSRILLALAEMAHSTPLTIASFGAPNPGAPQSVPVRSVLIDVANPVAAAAYLQVQDPSMQPLVVRIGHASLWVEFGAPSPLGLFQASS